MINRIRVQSGFTAILKPALALLITAAAFKAAGKPAAPEGLLVNGVKTPMAIERDATRFSWRSRSAGRGERQSAYQILVSSSAKALAADRGDWWDSGRVDSDQSASVEYAGRALPAAERFWWKVRTWDQTGRPSRYSAPACFDTGLAPGEWTANYVWDGTTNFNNFACFRKTFSLPRKPGLAKVYVTAHNDYLLYVNGRFVGRGPARCDPYRYGQYNAYDITRWVKRGSNVLAALGHWQGNWKDSGANARPAFLLEARFEYPDGSRFTLGTDGSWKVLAETPFAETNATYFGGAGGVKNRAAIRFDSRREPAGWQTVAFDDSRWAPATVVDRSDYRLFAQMAPMEREQAELKPVGVTRTNGAWLVDFGRCIDGWPKLTLRANHPGDIVCVQYFEMSGQRKPAGWDEYICRGGRETWDPNCGRHTSFQVLKITGYAGTLRASDVRGVWAYCDADQAGSFRCSSPLLNGIYQMCVRSAQQNVQQDIISVDANREQSPWLADSWNIGNVLLYNDRDTMMIDKVVRDYAAEQMPDGSFRDCSPSEVTWVCAEWSMYWPMLLWQQYLFSGDGTLLRSMAPRLTHFLDWMKTWQDPKTRLVDPRTARITDYAGGNTPSGGYNIATACQYYENLRIASRVFACLGQTNRSRGYLREAQEVKSGINSYLFNGDYYLARLDRQEMFPLASAWALRFGIEPAAEKSRILSLIEKSGKPDVGGYGGDALYSGLWNAGGGAFVVRDLARYRPMLNQNKANWERFDTRGEVNHAWSSYPGYLFLKYICGIRPTGGGFATFDVRPQTGGLTFAEGAVPTIKGLVRTRWEKRANSRFRLWIKVPPNTRASVYIPMLSSGAIMIWESGKRLWPAQPGVQDPGVLSVSEENSSVKCLVAAGTYRFEEIPAASGGIERRRPLGDSTAGQAPVTVTVSNAPGYSIPSDFAGLSFETWAELPDHNGVSGHLFSPTNTALITLFTNSGIRNLRLGGGTVDGLRAAVPSRADIDDVFGFAKAAGVKIIYSLRLLNGEPGEDAAAAKYIWTHYRPWLDCFAIGNEPNEPPYRRTPIGAITNYAAYLKAWRSFAASITHAVPGATFAGPDAGGTGWVADFARDEKSSGLIAVVTHHEYAGGKPLINHGRDEMPAAVAIDNMLSPGWLSDEYTRFYARTVARVGAEGLPCRMTEANDYLRGVTNASDAFASALWALDYLHWWAAHGCAGVDFHNNQWLKTDTVYLDASGNYRINPKAYGIRAFDLGSRGRAESVVISDPQGLNLTAYAVRDGSDLCVTIINKEHGPGARAAAVAIVPKGISPGRADVMFLSAPDSDAGATRGITLGGGLITDQAPWRGKWMPLGPGRAGPCEVTVPATSAAVVRISARSH